MYTDAYIDPVTPITDPTPYFKRDPKTRREIFIGETLEIRIPKRFEVYGLLDITDTVNTLGMMDMVIDGKYQMSMIIPAVIRIEPSEMGEMVVDGVPYLVLYLHNGDTFIANTQVAQDPSVIRGIYVEFITRGKPMYSLSYSALALIFDRVKQITGSGLGVDPALFELIISHQARDPHDLFSQYRSTPMKDPMRIVPLRSVTYAPSNTTTRIAGSYSEEGTVAALQTQTTGDQPLENIYRGIPQAL